MIDVPIDRVSSRSAGTVRSETSASEAARQLLDPAVPATVVLEAEPVVGIVTETDVVAYVAERRHLEIDWRDDPVRIDDDGQGIPVSE